MNVHAPMLLLALLATGLPAGAIAATDPARTTIVSVKLADTRAAMRDLWIGHVFWVRNAVDAKFEGDAAAATTAEAQIVANAKAIAGAIEPFYGESASKRLFTLLAGHWGAIKGYLDATHAGDKAGSEAAFRLLLTNAGEISAFLGGANPNLPIDVLKGLLTAHGSHHVQQIQEFQAQQFDAEAKTWAAMTRHMYVIADALADGIAKQFPDRFR